MLDPWAFPPIGESNLMFWNSDVITFFKRLSWRDNIPSVAEDPHIRIAPRWCTLPISLHS